jgi:hypothetical protein
MTNLKIVLKIFMTYFCDFRSGFFHELSLNVKIISQLINHDLSFVYVEVVRVAN